jgi:ABC-type uncharacterized transport system involved in gliding motility auxiliary subunit
MAVSPETPDPLEGGSREGALAEASTLRTVGLVLGVLGATAVAFGAILYAIDPGVLRVAVGNLAFGAVCIGFYVFTHRRSLGRALAGRSSPLVGLELMMAIGVLGGAFALNWVAANEPQEWDLTRDGVYSLHPQSVAVAERLARPVKIWAFYGPTDSTREILRQAVELYQMHTDELELELVNPDRVSRRLAKRFDLGGKSAPLVMEDVESGRYTKLKAPTEEAMTNALIEIAERRQRKAYFLEGHGEAKARDASTEDGYGTAATLLENEGLAVESLSLVERSDLPEDASVLIVPGPKAALLPNESAALKVFLDRGGRALLLLEPGYAHGLAPVLRPYGVDVGDDLVLDENPAAKALGFGADAPVIQRYEAHPITNVMEGRFAMFLRARSVSPRLGLARVAVTTLIQTSPDSWAETSTAGPPHAQGADDLAGPVPIAVAVEKRTANNPRKRSDEARLVVFGDVDFANNRFSAMTGNTDLFVNTVNWLVGDEDRITIRPPKKQGDRLPLTELQQYGIMFFSVNLLPYVIIGFGLSVWAVRRRK